MEKKFLFIGILAIFFSAFLFLSLAQPQPKPEDSSAAADNYSRIIDYLHKERTTKSQLFFTAPEYVLFFILDLMLSLACILAAFLLFTAIKIPYLKTFPWFFFIFNFAWVMYLLLFRLIWQTFGLMLIKLQPDIALPLADNFSLIILISACLIYVWLLARTFSLHFFSSLIIFLTSHLFYFLIIFLFFTFVRIEDNRFFNLLKDNLGVKAVIKSYLSDVNKLTSDQNMLNLIRIRPYHL